MSEKVCNWQFAVGKKIILQQANIYVHKTKGCQKQMTTLKEFAIGSYQFAKLNSNKQVYKFIGALGCQRPIEKYEPPVTR